MSLKFFYALFWCVPFVCVWRLQDRQPYAVLQLPAFPFQTRSSFGLGLTVQASLISQGALESYLSCFLSARFTSPHHLQVCKTWVLGKHFIDRTVFPPPQIISIYRNIILYSYYTLSSDQQSCKTQKQHIKVISFSMY